MSEPWPHKDDSGLPSWWERCLALMPPSVDLTQIEEDLRLTPTQRIEKLEALMRGIEALKRSR